jgi:hypothetical protein
VPDNSRKIFDDASKVKSLEILEKEFADLAISIFKELQPYVYSYNPSVILNKQVILAN